jgi:hypothetical protein
MEKPRIKVIPVLCAITFIGFSIWANEQSNEEREDIELHGIRAHAVVTNVYYAKGQSINVGFIYKGQPYHFDKARTTEFEVAPGDSVSLLFLPDKPDSGVLLEDRFYTVPRKSYFGWVDGH